MRFAEELQTLLEYSDYDVEVAKVIRQEFIMVHNVFSELKPNRGWGCKEGHNLSLTGTIPLEINRCTTHVPFGISYPLDYPKSPPICNILFSQSILINPSKRLNRQGQLMLKILSNWSQSNDSFEIIQQAVKYLSKHPPIFDLAKAYLTEMWRLRSQVDSLMSEKQTLYGSFQEVNMSLQNLMKVTEGTEIQDLKAECELIKSWITYIKGKEFNFDEVLIFENKNTKALAEIMALEEANEEATRKLTEAFNLKLVPASSFFVDIKSAFNQRFWLIKKKEKLLSIIN